MTDKQRERYLRLPPSLQVEFLSWSDYHHHWTIEQVDFDSFSLDDNYAQSLIEARLISMLANGYITIQGPTAVGYLVSTVTHEEGGETLLEALLSLADQFADLRT